MDRLIELKDKLEFRRDNIKTMIGKDQQQESDKFSSQYMSFLDKCKTERETVKYIKDIAVKNGYEKFDKSKRYKPGDKVYFNIKEKSIILSTIGQDTIDKGVSMVVSHVDSPRIDLKSRSLCSDGELAIFKTHYYGGIKKYQWVTMPLALHGVIVNRNEEKIDVCIGEEDDDVTFCITDLLPHLDKIQDRNRMNHDIIAGEQLNVIAGSLPLIDGEIRGDVKLNILKLLNEKYNVVEEDLISSDLSFVPAFKAKNIGLDRSLIGGYGQDDRVCCYPSLIAELETKNNRLTTVSIFADREEIGSRGNTGLASDILKNYLIMLCNMDIQLYMDCISNSTCLSADVKPAFDPTWSKAYDRYNSSRLNYGLCLAKYTGYAGKLDTSEASAELIRKIINIFSSNGVIWQTNLNKVDQGGGGTVAKFIADLGIDVIDVGISILSMHSPYEIIAKLDLYMMYKGIVNFLAQ